MTQNMLTTDDPQLLKFIQIIGSDGVNDETPNEDYNTESEENTNNSEE